MKMIGSLALSVVAAVLFTVTAGAHVLVTVTCPDGTPLPGVVLRLSGSCNPGLADVTTDNNGVALFSGFNSVCLGQQLTISAINFSASTTFTFPADNPELLVTLIIPDSPLCGPRGHCWLTAGGVKFGMAQVGPSDSVGGNVFPGCSATAGDGGQWTHISHSQNLQFQGQAVKIVSCGNVSTSIIPPGSKSPKTPFNYIEFAGTGRLKGISGNKADFGQVYFFARCEDHHEPGSNGAKSDNLVDRYYLNVFTDPADPVNSSVFLFDGDHNPATIDPLPITGGNMQIHISGCQ